MRYVVFLTYALVLAFGQFAGAQTRALDHETQSWQRDLNSPMSMMIRPISDVDSISRIGFLPLEVDSRYAAQDAFSRNDGSFFQSTGLQTRIRLGVHGSLGPLHVQLAPEWIQYGNQRSEDWYRFESQSEARLFITRAHNFIDLPERVSSDKSNRVIPGESFIELRLWALSTKVSTQNLWLGPGIRNSLILTNQSEGFPHAQFTTNRPIRTPLGSVEFMLMGGFLESISDYDPIVDRLESLPGYMVKSSDSRYFTTLTAAYQPRFLPGLWVGGTRSFLMYRSAINGWSDYLPMFQAFTKDNFHTDENVRGTDAADQKLAFYFRWDFVESGFEVYGEWGREDHALDKRDILGQPDHTRAYVLGTRKRSQIDDRMSVTTTIEQTVLSNTNTYLVRPTGSWYGHNLIRQGHTNRGQLLGSSLGPGGEGQYALIEIDRGKHQLAVDLERAVRNRDLQIEFADFDRKKWVDLAIGIRYRYEAPYFSIRTMLAIIHSRNAYYDENLTPTNLFVGTGIEIPVIWNRSVSR